MFDNCYDLAIGSTETFYMGTDQGAFKTTDAGATWQSLFAAMPSDERPVITAIGVHDDQAGRRTVIAATPGHILRTVNDGGSWDLVPLSEPAPVVVSIAFSPSFDVDQTIWAATLEDGVYLSQTAGRTWTTWNFGLYDQRVNAMVVTGESSSDCRISVAAQSDVFFSTNGGRSWRSSRFPVEAVPVIDIAVVNNVMIAATEDGEVWQCRESEWHKVVALDVSIKQLVPIAENRVWMICDGPVFELNGHDPKVRKMSVENLQMATASGSMVIACDSEGQFMVLELSELE